MIGIQGKQSLAARKCIGDDEIVSASFNTVSFQTERAKFPANDIFVWISDADHEDIVLGDKDILVDYENFTEHAQPLIASQKLYSVNQVNPKF